MPILHAGLAWLLLAEAAAPVGFEAAIRKMGLAYHGRREYRAELFLPARTPRIGRPGFWRLVAADGARRLRLEVDREVGPEALSRRVREFEVRLAVAAEGEAAYPGAITRRVEVPVSLRLRVLRPGPPGERVYLLPATARLTYGAGAEDLVAYRALAAFRYHADRRLLLRVEVFVPKGGADLVEAEAELASFGAAGSDRSSP